MFLNYEEQAVIKMYNFSSKEELIEKLNNSLKEIKDEDMCNIVRGIISKVDNYSVEDLKNIDNIFE